MENHLAGLATVPVRTAGEIVAMAVALAVAAQVSLPMVPVPMTLQSLALVLIGLHFRAGVSVSAVGLYLLLGACGLPVFAGGGAGVATLTGDSAGYLWAFVPAAALLSSATKSGFIATRKQRFGAGIVAHVCILTLGSLWLATHLGLGEAMRYGFLPFLPGAVIKSALSAY